MGEGVSFENDRPAGTQSLLKRVLIISLNFPPSTIASVHRARHLAKYLPIHGWQPCVLTVDERFHKEPPDPDLASLVPHNVEVVKVRALPLAITQWFGLGDLALRALLPVSRAVAKLAGDFRPNVVFI